MRSYIYDMARWAGFLAIVGFVYAGITVLSAFTIGAALDSDPQLASMLGKFGPLGKVIFTLANLVFAFALFYPSLLLFKYAANAKNGVLYGEQLHLNEAFAKLKSLFSYWGVITIIMVTMHIFMMISVVFTKVAM